MTPEQIARKKAKIAQAREQAERLEADAHGLGQAVTFWPDLVLEHPMLPLLLLENPENANLVRRARAEMLWYRRGQQGLTEPDRSAERRDDSFYACGDFRGESFEELDNEVNRMGQPYDYREDGDGGHWFDVMPLFLGYAEEFEPHMDVSGMEEAMPEGMDKVLAWRVRVNLWGKDQHSGDWTRTEAPMPTGWLRDV